MEILPGSIYQLWPAFQKTNMAMEHHHFKDEIHQIHRQMVVFFRIFHCQCFFFRGCKMSFLTVFFLDVGLSSSFFSHGYTLTPWPGTLRFERNIYHVQMYFPT